MLSRVQKATEYSRCAGGRLRVGKRVVPGKNRHQGLCTKDVVVDKVDTTRETVRVSIYAIRDDVPKIEGKHLVFKSSINRIKTRLLVDNGSETELIDKSFVRTNKISTFKLKKVIKLTLGNGEVVQTLTRGCLVNVEIGDHKEQILCYLAKLDVYTVILGDE